MQMASAYSAIANGGHLCEPHLAEQIQTSDGKRIHKIGSNCHDLPYTQQEISLVQEGLRQVVAPGSGTASAAFAGFPLSQVPVMGKTGTAERPGFTTVAGQTQSQDTSWFAAIVGPPGDQHVIVAMVEQGGHGSTTAAPIVRTIIEDMYKLGRTGAAGTVATD
jgi:penicillin-binding protein 2